MINIGHSIDKNAKEKIALLFKNYKTAQKRIINRNYQKIR